jgi:hypothetical protein
VRLAAISRASSSSVCRSLREHTRYPSTLSLWSDLDDHALLLLLAIAWCAARMVSTTTACAVSSNLVRSRRDQSSPVLSSPSLSSPVYLTTLDRSSASGRGRVPRLLGRPAASAANGRRRLNQGIFAMMVNKPSSELYNADRIVLRTDNLSAG